jgi:hypothetical protein
MGTSAVRVIAATLAIAAATSTIAAQAPAPKPQAPLAVLKAGIERAARSVNATWGLYIKSIETGEEIAIGARAEGHARDGPPATGSRR